MTSVVIPVTDEFANGWFNNAFESMLIDYNFDEPSQYDPKFEEIYNVKLIYGKNSEGDAITTGVVFPSQSDATMFMLKRTY